jgi:deazaflavin-dependent oxidoreductase (nitroreductase family)
VTSDILNPTNLVQQGFRALNSVVRPAVKVGIGNPFPVGAGAVVLETTGRKSGLVRFVPVLATRIGDVLTVSTVRDDSQWLANIEADENVAVWLQGHRHGATAAVNRGAISTVRVELAES